MAGKALLFCLLDCKLCLTSPNLCCREQEMVESSSFHTTSCSAKRCADFKSLGSRFKVLRTKMELKVKKGFFCLLMLQSARCLAKSAQ